MLRIRACLLLSLFVTGCKGDQTGPRVDASSTVGMWTAQVGAASGCWPAFQFTFELKAVQAASVSSDGSYYLISGTGWYIGETGPMPYTGTVRLDGQPSTLKFWKQILVAGGDVSATLARDGANMSGSFRDQGNAFTLRAGCSASFTASK